MPVPDHVVRQGDVGQLIEGVLRDADGEAVSISGATVRFVVAPLAGGAAVVDEVASNDQSTDPETIGMVSYEWTEDDTAVPGWHVAEWEVTFAGGGQQTFPNEGYVLILITPQLAANLP